ncbi:hypothetical protein CRYUN_Cryun11dG0069800 [Craigia yunnanensis]
MSRAEELWERLVRAALTREIFGMGTIGQPVGGIAGYVPSSFENNRDIDSILRAANEIQDEDPNVSRILCEHAYSLAQNLDPNSEGRGVLQFKTGLMSGIKQKLVKREGGTINRSQDIARLQEFYKLYREKNNVDKLREEEMKLRASGVFSGNLGELERKTVKRKNFFGTLRVLGMVLEQLTEEIPEELKQVIDSDAAMTEDLIAYNIIPLDAPTITNAIVSFPEVVPDTMVKCLPAIRLVTGLYFYDERAYKKDNVSNQREHIVLLLANEQSQLGIPEEPEPKLDEATVQKVFLKSLENYIKWCNYLCIQPVWSNLDAVSKEKKLLFVSLYFLIWGEAANIRFPPECLCYIFHHMVREMDEILRQQIAQPANSCCSENGVSFLDQVITPLFEVVAAEAANNDNGRAPHSAWRNYDDFNEYFWAMPPTTCGYDYLQNPLKSGGGQRRGKTSFVEHRTFFHLYHSFHRLWLFLVMMFQGLTIIAFNDGHLNSKTLREVLSLGPTFVVMKFIESVLDVLMMYGAYSTTRRLAVSRIFLRFVWFSVASVFISFLYVKALQEESKPNSNSVVFRLYLIVIGIYGGIQFFISFLMRIPACHHLTNQCDRWPLIRFIKWMRQERYYVGLGMYERTTDFIKYMVFWLIILSGKFAFAYFFQIMPLVKPTRTIVTMDSIQYSWHDFVSKNNHNALTVASLWAPVIAMYLLDIYLFYTVLSAVWGFLLGARDRLGEIRSLDAVQKHFEEFPAAFMKTLHPVRTSASSSNQYKSAVNSYGTDCSVFLKVVEKNKFDAARFSPFWNEIIKNLREEDYLTNFEMELLFMPKNTGSLPLVQWPLFLLASKIFLAKDIAAESRDYSQVELWERISRDDYMRYAVQECYHTLQFILTEILEDEGRMWVGRIYEGIETSMENRSVHVDFQLNKLQLVISRVTALLGILSQAEKPEHEKGAVQAVQDLYDVVRHDVLAINMRENYEQWNNISKARTEGRLFAKLKWPRDPELKAQVKRLHSLLTIKDSAPNVPKNLEARRRLEFFTNSLFMGMPPSRPVHEMPSLSMNELLKKNEDGISILFYLQKIYPDEWKNFLSRIGRDENAAETELYDSPSDILELRFWASYQGQTLARTVRGMMYYRKALMLQTYLERENAGDTEAALSRLETTDTQGFELSPEARARADLKFTYVVTCQIYGKQKEEQKPEAADIALLMQRNEALRVAFIDVVETLKDGKVHTEYYSKLVKADINGKDKDNYFEEALKVRNLLEEFHHDHGIRPPTILGVREHVFTGSVSSLASFMSNQESCFVTLGQRVLANPLKVQMHYGHPNVFDRVFHITRGGISKASRIINISEDIYAGFNSTLRQGNITHHEYIQVGKGRDVGLNQIALFEGKVAGVNGEQLTVLTIYIFLYGRAYLALSGVGETMQVRAQITDNTALETALNTQFLFQIGIFSAVPMILGFILEQGFLRAVVSFITMQLQLCTVFFTFSLGTKLIILVGQSCMVVQGTVEDFRDWTNWLLYRGGIGVKGEESWEAWWDEELAHIRSIRGRILETILSLRFFIFQYGIVYKLHVQGTNTSLTVYGLSWIVLAVLILLFK